MRISDWSSDVCSSDLRAQYGIAASDRLPTIGIGANAQITRNPENLRANSDSGSVSRYYQAGVGMTSFELDFFGRVRNLSEAAFQQYLATAQAEIGRASCRERVGKYG